MCSMMKEFLFYLKFVWQYVRDLKVKLIKYTICHIVGIGISVVVPILSAKAIVNLTSNAWQQLILVAFVMYALENVRNIIHYIANYNAQIVYPIVSNGDSIGTVILMSKDSNTKMNEVEKKVAQSAATFLATQMEI